MNHRSAPYNVDGSYVRTASWTVFDDADKIIYTAQGYQSSGNTTTVNPVSIRSSIRRADLWRRSRRPAGRRRRPPARSFPERHGAGKPGNDAIELYPLDREPVLQDAADGKTAVYFSLPTSATATATASWAAKGPRARTASRWATTTSRSTATRLCRHHRRLYGLPNRVRAPAARSRGGLRHPQQRDGELGRHERQPGDRPGPHAAAAPTRGTTWCTGSPATRGQRRRPVTRQPPMSPAAAASPATATTGATGKRA